jgi:hypothetical protein
LPAPKVPDDLLAAQEDECPQVPCNECGRTFRADRIAKHTVVCKTTAKKAAKRRVFDSAQHRIEGTEMKEFAHRIHAEPAQPSSQERSAKWRREHEDFVANIREARAYTKAVKEGKPPPPVHHRPNPHANDGLKCCPHCQRTFLPDVADRHIPRCHKNARKGQTRQVF